MKKADGGDGADPLQWQRDLYHTFEAKKLTSVAEKKAYESGKAAACENSLEYRKNDAKERRALEEEERKREIVQNDRAICSS